MHNRPKLKGRKSQKPIENLPDNGEVEEEAKAETNKQLTGGENLSEVDGNRQMEEDVAADDPVEDKEVKEGEQGEVDDDEEEEGEDEENELKYQEEQQVRNHSSQISPVQSEEEESESEDSDDDEEQEELEGEMRQEDENNQLNPVHSEPEEERGEIEEEDENGENEIEAEEEEEEEQEGEEGEGDEEEQVVDEEAYNEVNEQIKKHQKPNEEAQQMGTGEMQSQEYNLDIDKYKEEIEKAKKGDDGADLLEKENIKYEKDDLVEMDKEEALRKQQEESERRIAERKENTRQRLLEFKAKKMEEKWMKGEVWDRENDYKFRWKMEELAEQARLSPVEFRAELTSRQEENNFSDSLENLLEDEEEEEVYDESEAEQQREQQFENMPSQQFLDYFNDETMDQNGPIEFKSIESDLKNMTESPKGPLDDLENIDDLNVLNEITQNMDSIGTSCILINDPLNETTTSAEVLQEISDNMTTELLGFFASESIPENPETETKVAEDQKVPEGQKPGKRGHKRLLPSWMKVGNADPKHFKMDQDVNVKEEMSAAEFRVAVEKEHSEFNASCDICDFRDVNRKNVMKHRRTDHKNLPFHCKVCGRTFNAAQQLVTHRLNNHMKQLVLLPRYCALSFGILSLDNFTKKSSSGQCAACNVVRPLWTSIC